MNRILSLIISFLLASTFLLQAQTGTDVLPLNPKASTGKLPNGITYYILPNQKPEKKVELRLIINTGSLSEDDDQQGLAHMAEHMAFNGTTNFKKNDIVSFLQDIGVGFGNDLNAYTFFDRTVYILPIPVEKPGNLEKGFQVLEDWAHNVTYLTEDIEGERAIILEESRLGKGADERMMRQWLPLYFNGSRYASRLPIGKDSIIKNFPPQRIRDFYRDWYRPDLMAVAVVGDITREKALELIQKHFSGIKPVANPRPLPAFEFPAYQQDLASINTDREATSYAIQIAWPASPEKALTTMADYRRSLVKSLFTAMLNSRYREITQKPNPPFVFAAGSFSSYVRGFDQFSLNAGTGSENPMKALDALIAEVERMKKFGFTAPELERAKKNLLANYESSYNNRDKTESFLLIDEFVNLYLDGTAAPGIENEYNYVKTFLPAITLEEVNALAAPLKGDAKKFISITGPENAAVKLPTEAELIAAVEKAGQQTVTAYEEKAVATSLLAAVPRAGKIVSRKKNPQTTATDLVLSNGVTVSIKATDFKDDEIILMAQRPGGTSNYGLADLYSARYAGAVQAAMGYGSFTPADLQKALSGKKVTAGAMMSDTRDMISGNSTVKDLETMFQLLYLKLTGQRKDTALYQSFLKKQKAQMMLMMANPQTSFIDTLGRFLYNNSPLAPISIPKAADFDKIDLDRSMAIYRERAGDVTGMHFVITGSFREETLLPLIETYLASLPASGKKTQFRDNKVRPLKGSHRFTYEKGKEEKSLVLQIHSGDVAYSEDLKMKAEAMTEAMNIRIIEDLREKVQGIYGGGIQGGLSKEPYPNFQLLVVLPTGPAKVDTLLTALHAEIDTFQQKGPSVDLLNKVKKQWLESHKEDLKDNSAWAEALLENKVDKVPFARFLNYESFVNKLTPKDLQQAARLLLNNKNRVIAVQMPEKKKETKPEEKKPF